MDVKLPHLGEGADSGVVVSILVKVGDTVQTGSSLDRAGERESRGADSRTDRRQSRRKIHVREGQRINVGQLVVSLAGVDAAEAAAVAEPVAALRKVPPAKGAKIERAAGPEPVAIDPAPAAAEVGTEAEAESGTEAEAETGAAVRLGVRFDAARFAIDSQDGARIWALIWRGSRAASMAAES